MNITLASGKTATGASASVRGPRGRNSYQFRLTGSGALSAVGKIEVSNDGQNWLTLANYTLSGVNAVDDGAGVPAHAPVWAYQRDNLTSLTGTGAALTVIMFDEQL